MEAAAKRFQLWRLDTRKGAEEGFELQLVSPQDGTPIPIWITVLGADSDAYRKTLNAQQKKRMDRMARGRRFQATPEDMEADALEVLAACTVTWRTEGEVELDAQGTPMPQFSKAAAKQLYANFPWIKEQVDAAIVDRSNFLPKSASS